MAGSWTLAHAFLTCISKNVLRQGKSINFLEKMHVFDTFLKGLRLTLDSEHAKHMHFLEENADFHLPGVETKMHVAKMLESRWQHAKNMLFFEENACFDLQGLEPEMHGRDPETCIFSRKMRFFTIQGCRPKMHVARFPSNFKR